jgi:ABC-2 type transport system ATP-binding protein
MDLVERLCSRVVILHKGRTAANDSIANLRTLLALPTLEEIFAQLAVEQDTAAITQDILTLVEL